MEAVSRFVLTCARCGKLRSERIAYLQTNPEMRCAGCGARLAFRLDDLRSAQCGDGDGGKADGCSCTRESPASECPQKPARGARG